MRSDPPAVNAADPQAPYQREPGCNDGRADLGAYGNTSEATEQPPLGQIVTRAVTLTNSGQVTDTYMLTIRGSNAQFQADCLPKATTPFAPLFWDRRRRLT